MALDGVSVLVLLLFSLSRIIEYELGYEENGRLRGTEWVERTWARRGICRWRKRALRLRSRCRLVEGGLLAL